MGLIKISIHKKTAEIKAEGVGFTGQACALPMEEVLDAIGATTVTKKMKTEKVIICGQQECSGG